MAPWLTLVLLCCALVKDEAAYSTRHRSWHNRRLPSTTEFVILNEMPGTPRPIKWIDTCVNNSRKLIQCFHCNCTKDSYPITKSCRPTRCPIEEFLDYRSTLLIPPPVCGSVRTKWLLCEECYCIHDQPELCLGLICPLQSEYDRLNISRDNALTRTSLPAWVEPSRNNSPHAGDRTTIKPGDLVATTPTAMSNYTRMTERGDHSSAPAGKRKTATTLGSVTSEGGAKENGLQSSSNSVDKQSNSSTIEGGANSADKQSNSSTLEGGANSADKQLNSSTIEGGANSADKQSNSSTLEGGANSADKQSNSSTLEGGANSADKQSNSSTLEGGANSADKQSNSSTLEGGANSADKQSNSSTLEGGANSADKQSIKNTTDNSDVNQNRNGTDAQHSSNTSLRDEDKNRTGSGKHLTTDDATDMTATTLEEDDLDSGDGEDIFSEADAVSEPGQTSANDTGHPDFHFNIIHMGDKLHVPVVKHRSLAGWRRTCGDGDMRPFIQCANCICRKNNEKKCVETECQSDLFEYFVPAYIKNWRHAPCPPGETWYECRRCVCKGTKPIRCVAMKSCPPLMRALDIIPVIEAQPRSLSTDAEPSLRSSADVTHSRRPVTGNKPTHDTSVDVNALSYGRKTRKYGFHLDEYYYD